MQTTTERLKDLKFLSDFPTAELMKMLSHALMEMAEYSADKRKDFNADDAYTYRVCFPWMQELQVRYHEYMWIDKDKAFVKSLPLPSR